MRFLSVCSGIEAASVAWAPLGWHATAFAEIDPFASAVLAHRFPSVPNRGDMTRFQEWPDEADLDLLCGGTPCQSFSVAGKRAGLADPRGDLMLTFGAIAARYRPKWLVWENVPGVLSSNRGRDFGTFLGMLGQLGYGFAYRVLDAQYFGVPQRRRRVFVVGCAGDWRRAAAVLFERHSLQGHPAPRREAGESAAVGAGGRAAGGICSTLNASMGKGKNGQDVGALIAFGGGNTSSPIDVAACFMHHGGRLDFDSETFIAHTLRGEGFDASEDGTGRGTPLVPVAFDWSCGGNTGLELSREGGPTIRASKPLAVADRMGVRRITPLEAERLQGFPEGWTAIPYRGKPAADSPRYRALGNSWAVPVARWVGERIAAVDAIAPARQEAA